MVREGSGSGDPSPQQLRLFLLLARELHFGRAARRAYLTQPAFSQQIRSLERRMGLTLVDRSTRTIGLTAAGRSLLPQMRAVVRAADRLRETVAGPTHGLAGRLVVGSFEALAAVQPMRAVLDALRLAHPGLEVEVRRMGFGDWAELLLSGAVDAAFVLRPVPPGVQSLELATMGRVVCLPAADPLAGSGPLTFGQLADRAHIGWSPRAPKPWRDFWSADPRPGGAPVRYSAHQAADFESALLVIAMGEGIQFPPEPARRLYPRAGVAYAEVAGLPPCSAALAWRTQDRDRPGVAALRGAARTVAG
ncbi:LysR family transcriptional regulator [Streptomyces sp. 796.1]|uniref:LysR family transcriptional regulator n=1 Tax=Streptomyces sp. 796.1 TaxID=3163029 RepID=UPI0039C9C890